MKSQKMTKVDYLKVGKVVDRVFKEKLNYSDRMTIIMDISATCEDVGLDLDKLLGFDKFNFGHDICGISQNINRRTAKIDNCFLPRSSR